MLIDVPMRLLKAFKFEDPTSAFYEVVDDLKASRAGLDSVRAILLFMEAYPEKDYGVRGPLVHYMETFHGSGYEQELLSSVARRPMPQTVSMLNALINGTRDLAARTLLIEALRAAGRHPSSDNETRERVEHYLARLRDLGPL
jgi:hypothetical protein